MGIKVPALYRSRLLIPVFLMQRAYVCRCCMYETPRNSSGTGTTATAGNPLDATGTHASPGCPDSAGQQKFGEPMVEGLPTQRTKGVERHPANRPAVQTDGSSKAGLASAIATRRKEQRILHGLMDMSQNRPTDPEALRRPLSRRLSSSVSSQPWPNPTEAGQAGHRTR